MNLPNFPVPASLTFSPSVTSHGHYTEEDLAQDLAYARRQ
jgi:hypothetical protein